MTDFLSALSAWLLDVGFYDAFAKDVRPGFFSGFLTISGFLYSAHTFIVIHMKKELYGTDRYRRRIKARRKNNPQHAYYGTLRRLSRFLMASVCLSLATAVFQVTFGLHRANWSAVACVVMAVASLGMLVASIVAMAANLKIWFDDLEDAERPKQDADVLSSASVA
jgi:hypothetical protein